MDSNKNLVITLSQATKKEKNQEEEKKCTDNTWNGEHLVITQKLGQPWLGYNKSYLFYLHLLQFEQLKNSSLSISVVCR